LFRQGENEYAAGRYEVAIELWERAYAMDPRAGLQYNLAQAYGRTGMIVEERHALELFLARLAEVEPEAMSGSEASSARARIAAIDARLARTAIVLRGVPRHAVVTIDGSAAQMENGRVPVSAGSHAIRVELPGFLPFTTTVAVVPAATAEVDVELHVAPQEERETLVVTGAPVVEEERPSRAPIAMLVTGGVIFAGGSALGGLAIHHSRGTFRDTSEAEQGRRFGIGADVSLGVGLALATTGLVLVLVRDDAPSDEPSPTVAVGMTGTAMGTAMPAMEVTW
jgi:hypothetical protein